MLAEAEYCRAALRLIAADAFEHGGAVVKGVGQDVDFGVFKGDESSVKPDRVLHGADLRIGVVEAAEKYEVVV
jgi:hypothetical protein